RITTVSPRRTRKEMPSRTVFSSKATWTSSTTTAGSTSVGESAADEEASGRAGGRDPSAGGEALSALPPRAGGSLVVAAGEFIESSAREHRGADKSSARELGCRRGAAG